MFFFVSNLFMADLVGIHGLQVLKSVPFPYTITTFQFASGSFFITLMWLLNLHPKPRLSLGQVTHCSCQKKLE
jgi:hypothetical protein